MRRSVRQYFSESLSCVKVSLEANRRGNPVWLPGTLTPYIGGKPAAERDTDATQGCPTNPDFDTALSEPCGPCALCVFAVRSYGTRGKRMVSSAPTRAMRATATYTHPRLVVRASERKARRGVERVSRTARSNNALTGPRAGSEPARLAAGG